MNINEPFYQECSASVFYFLLYLWDVFVVNLIEWLQFNHGLVYLLGIFSNGLGVSHIQLVAEYHWLYKSLPILSYSLLTLFSNLFCPWLLKVWRSFFNWFGFQLLLGGVRWLSRGCIVGFRSSQCLSSLLDGLLFERCLVGTKIVGVVSLNRFGMTL